jgi:hypothetical protein
MEWHHQRDCHRSSSRLHDCHQLRHLAFQSVRHEPDQSIGAARGTESSDLLLNLFEAYEIVPGRKFNKRIENKKDDYEEGTATTVSGLMHQELIRFKDLRRSNKWQAPTAEEEQIVALTAQVKKLKWFTKKTKGTGSAATDDKRRVSHKNRDDDPGEAQNRGPA